EPLDRLAPVARELDLVALELARAPRRLAHGPLVVHHQDLHPPHCAYGKWKGVKPARPPPSRGRRRRRRRTGGPGVPQGDVSPGYGARGGVSVEGAAPASSRR